MSVCLYHIEAPNGVYIVGFEDREGEKRNKNSETYKKRKERGENVLK